MKFFTFKLLTIAIAASALTFTSCKKDKDEPTSCKLTRTIFADSSVPDTATYVYTGDNISRINFSATEYMTVEYSNNKVSKRSYFDPSMGTSAFMYQTFAYNSEGNVTLVETYYTGGSTPMKYMYETYTYTSGKLSSLKVYYFNGTTFDMEEEYTYTYTGNNITTMVYTDHFSGSPITETYTYQYDNNPNHFSKLNPHAAFTDAAFMDATGFALALVTSANNVTSFTIDGTDVTTLGYELDSKGNLFKVIADGQVVLIYNNTCQ